MSLQKLQRKILPCFFQVLMAIGIPWLPWLVTTITPLSVSIFMSPSPLYVYVFSSSITFKDIYHWNQGPPRYSRMISSQDNYLHLQRAFFQIRDFHRLQGLGLGRIFFGPPFKPLHMCTKWCPGDSKSTKYSLKKFKTPSKLTLDEEEKGLDSLQERIYKQTKCPMSGDPPLCLLLKPLCPTGRGWTP